MASKKSQPPKPKPQTKVEAVPQDEGISWTQFFKMAFYALLISMAKSLGKLITPSEADFFSPYTYLKDIPLTWAILTAAMTCLYMSNEFSKQKRSSGLVGGVMCLGTSLAYHAISS